MTAPNSSCCSTAATAPKEVVLEKQPSAKNGIMSFLSTLLIILIPKCPFCIAAYTGAFMLFFDIDNKTLFPYFQHAKPVLGIIILLLIAFNYNPKKSKVALAIVSVALSLLLASTYLQIYILPDGLVYIGFFFAAWYNGNFRYFYRYIKSLKWFQTASA